MRFLCLLACLQILLADETLYVVDGPVARSRWDNSSDFATHVTQHFDHPVILTHTPFAMNSDAPKLWTPEFLAKTVTDGVFYNVKRLPSASSSFMFPSDMPMADDPDLLFGYRPHYSRHDMTVRQFYEFLREPEIANKRLLESCSAGGHEAAQQLFGDGSPFKLKYAAPLDADLADTYDPRPLAPVDPELPPGKSTIEKVYLWIGGAGALTPCHFDIYSNMYHQIQGRKRFRLFSPDQHTNMYLYPSLHPAHRSSRVALRSSQINYTSQVFPRATGGSIHAVEAVLDPGDILYIPAMWLHEVEALDEALSVNVWSKHAGIELMEDSVAHAVHLFTGEFESTAQRVEYLKSFLNLILGDLPLEADDPLQGSNNSTRIHAFLHRHLTDGRYYSYNFYVKSNPSTTRLQAQWHREESEDPWDDNGALRDLSHGSRPGDDLWPRFCHNQEAAQALLSADPFMLRTLVNTAEDIIKDLRSARQIAGHARYQIWLLNLIERAVYNGAGIRYVQQFLWDFLRC
eukprot:m.157779 g.157779  ORF g.157779 m.157779 type:complete len:516 (+) comp24733_c0_seq3:59-1606(+)